MRRFLDTRKPAVDTDIFIPRGIWMMIDYPLPRMRSLRVDGVLEFEQVCYSPHLDNYIRSRFFSH